MKNRVSSIIWGVLFIIAGIGFVGNAFWNWHFQLFFEGWWTLFIIVPSIVSICQRPKMLSIGAFIIGVLLLLSCQGLFDFSVISKLIFPVVLIAIGASIITKNMGIQFGNAIPVQGQQDVSDFAAVFSSKKVVFTENEVFTGSTLNAVFGGVELDLRSAIINEDVVIESCSVFGGIQIYVPDDVNIKISSTPIFGGVGNRRHRGNFIAGAPTIYINAMCMFGGVEIR